jgi:hypothetical protein
VGGAQVGDHAGAALGEDLREAWAALLGLLGRGQQGVVLLDEVLQRAGEGVREGRLADRMEIVEVRALDHRVALGGDDDEVVHRIRRRPIPRAAHRVDRRGAAELHGLGDPRQQCQRAQGQQGQYAGSGTGGRRHRSRGS